MPSTTRRPSRNTLITEGKLLVWSPCDFRYQLSVTPDEYSLSNFYEFPSNIIIQCVCVCVCVCLISRNSNSIRILNFRLNLFLNGFLTHFFFFFFLVLVDFNQDGQPDNISFMIKRVKVHGEDALNDPTYRFTGTYGVEEFLELFSGKPTIFIQTNFNICFLCVVALDVQK